MDISRLAAAFNGLAGWNRAGFIKHDGRLKALEINRKIISAVANQAEFDQTVNSAPSQEEIFNTWYRFSHGSTQTFPFLPAETLDWALNPDGSIRNTFNSVSWIGVVGPNKYKQFVLDVDIWSTNADDDTIGLAVCFDKDPVTGAESVITVSRSTGGTALYEVWYNPAQAAAGGTYRIFNGAAFVKWGNGQPGTMTKAEAGQGNNDPGWGAVAARRGGIANGKVRLRIERKDDIITFQTSDWDNPDLLLPESLFTLDLKSNPKLEKFRNGARYGFLAASQQDSYWKVREFSNPNDAIYRLDTNKVYKNIGGEWVEAPDIPMDNLGTNVWLFNPATKKSFYRIDSQKTLSYVEPVIPATNIVPIATPSGPQAQFVSDTSNPAIGNISCYFYGYKPVYRLLQNNIGGNYSFLDAMGSINNEQTKYGAIVSAFVERIVITRPDNSISDNVNVFVVFADNRNPMDQIAVTINGQPITLWRQQNDYVEEDFVVAVTNGTPVKKAFSGQAISYSAFLITDGAQNAANGSAIWNAIQADQNLTIAFT